VIPLEAQLMAAIDAWMLRHPDLATVLGVGCLMALTLIPFAYIAWGH